MTDAERGRELYWAIQHRRKMKKAHPKVQAIIQARISELGGQAARRFVEELGPDNWLVRDLGLEKQRNEELG